MKSDNENSNLKKAARRDRGLLRKPVLTQQGFLLAEGVGAIAGVHDYLVRGPDGQPKIIRELIDDDVLRQDAGQIGRLPLTLEHPSVDVSPENISDLGVGDVGDRVSYVEDAQGGFVQLSVCARRADAISLVMDGKASELSFGYDVMIDPTPGVHPVYGRFDQRQVARVYNHLALVSQARHGKEARLRMDEANRATGEQAFPNRLDALAESLPTTQPQTGQGGPSMEFLRAIAAQMSVPKHDTLTEAELQQAITDCSSTLIDRSTSLTNIEAELAELRGDRSDMGVHELIKDMLKVHAKEKADLSASYKSDLTAMQEKVSDLTAQMEKIKMAKPEEEEEGIKMGADENVEEEEEGIKMDSLNSELAELKKQLEALTVERDGYKSKADAADQAAKVAAEAVELGKLVKVAEAFSVATSTDGTPKPLAVLRKDCAEYVYGAALPENSDSLIEGLLAPALRRLDAGEGVGPDTPDNRYEPWRSQTTTNQTKSSARHSLRSRADSMHTTRRTS